VRHDHKGISPEFDIERLFIEPHDIQVNRARRIFIRRTDASEPGFDGLMMEPRLKYA